MDNGKRKIPLLIFSAVVIAFDLLCADFVCSGAGSIFFCLLVLACASACFAVLLFSGFLKKIFQKNRTRRIVGVLLCVLVMFIAFTAFLNVTAYRNTADENTEAIVVLGAGIEDDEPSFVLRRRLDATAELAAENPEIVIVVTGSQGENEAYPEAEVMKNYLVRRGIAENRIYEEAQADNTKENFAYSLNVLKTLGYSEKSRIAYSTNAFHCFRAGVYAQMEGYENASPLPSSVRLIEWLPCYVREAGAICKMLLVMITEK